MSEPVPEAPAAPEGPQAPEAPSAPGTAGADASRVTAPPLVAGNAPFLATLALVAAGFAYTAIVPEHWLRGVLIAAGGFLLGAALRLVLPDGRAGMLKIRGRALDVACFGGVAVLIVTVGVLLPH
jgi:hypothetical protein